MEAGRSKNAPLKLSHVIGNFLRRCCFQILSYGPIPRHIAFILDGNRRYARKCNLRPGEGHRAGFSVLLTVLKYCYEMGIKYVTMYAFSIDNFHRKPSEVQQIMDLLLQKIEDLLKDLDFLNQMGLRIRILGKLDLLDEPIRAAATKLKEATSGNSKMDILVCIAYTSTDEIVRGVNGMSEEMKWKGQLGSRISPEDLERHMDFAGCPDPDIMIRTSGETRLSNFMLWQSSYCALYAPSCLWPEISLRHLVWAVLLYQRAYPYLEKRKKQK